MNSKLYLTRSIFHKYFFYFPYIYFTAIMLFLFIKNLVMLPNISIWFHMEILGIGVIFIVQAIKQFRLIDDILGIAGLFYSAWMTLALYSDFLKDGMVVLSPLVMSFIVLNYIATYLLFFHTKQAN